MMEAESDWMAQEREQYQADQFKWLYERFGSLTRRIEEEIRWHANDTKANDKELVQNALNSLERGLVNTRESVIFWVAIICLVALASAGLWIGVGCLAAILALGRLSMRSIQNNAHRLDRFRQRFRELLKAADRPYEEMLAEDKEFLRKYEDSVLYPLAVARSERENAGVRELFQVETLYREYTRGLTHLHGGHLPGSPNPNDTTESCQLCMAARRVRNNINDAISKFEAEIESARRTLIAKTGEYGNPQGAVVAKDFLADFRLSKAFYSLLEDLANGDEKLLAWLNSLGEKAYWTFEEADKVRELCTARRKGEWHWLEQWEREPIFDKVLNKLTSEMGACAERRGLQELWAWFCKARDHRRKADGAFKEIQRIMGRHNPTAMFREFGILGPTIGDTVRLRQLCVYHGGLDKWGFDRKLVEQEIQTAKKLIAAENRKWENIWAKELQSAINFALWEESVEEQRYKDYKGL